MPTAPDRGRGQRTTAPKDNSNGDSSSLGYLLRVPLGNIIAGAMLGITLVGGLLSLNARIADNQRESATNDTQHRAEIDAIIQRSGAVETQREQQLTELHSEIGSLEGRINILREQFEGFKAQGSRYTKEDAALDKLASQKELEAIRREVGIIDYRITDLERHVKGGEKGPGEASPSPDRKRH